MLRTTEEINVNEIRIDLGSFTWHAPKPLHTSILKQTFNVFCTNLQCLHSGKLILLTKHFAFNHQINALTTLIEYETVFFNSKTNI